MIGSTPGPRRLAQACRHALLLGLLAAFAAAAPPAARGQAPAPSADDPALGTVTPVPELPPPPDPSAASASRASETGPGAVPAAAPTTVGRKSLLRLFRQANFMLWPMVFCSVVALAFALERWVALRRARVLPREFVDRFLERVGGGKIDRERALELCRANDCAAARVFARIVQHWGASTTVLQDVADREIAAETQDLKRNVRALNATATLSPLLGLLGTVVGMIEAFDSLTGDLGGMGKNEALAHGISVALLATALGLVIAILSVVFYYVLIHKADALGRALEIESNRLIDQVAADPAAAPLVELRR